MTQQFGLGRSIGVAQGLGGLRAQQQQFDVNQMNMQNVQADRAAAEQAAEAQARRQQLLQQKLQGVVNPETGRLDPRGFTDLLLTDPETAGAVREQFGLVDEQRNAQLVNQAFGAKQLIESAGTPEAALQALQDSGLMDDPMFAQLADNLQAGDMEGALNEIGYGVAVAGGPEAYREIFGGGNAVGDVGTFNPRDYTEESLAEFVAGGRQDPSVLERYYPLKQTEIAGTTYFADDRGNLFLPASPEVQQQNRQPATGAGQQPAGPAMQPDSMTPEAQALREADRTRRIEQARREAAAEAEAASPEAQEMQRLKQQEVDRTRNLVDRLLASDNLGKISGAETAVPLVGGAQAAFARDELNDLKSLANLLTMGNLGRMSGVLSESDIRLIATAASGMEIGDAGTPISEERLREILQDIKGRLPNGGDQGEPAPSGSVNWSDL